MKDHKEKHLEHSHHHDQSNHGHKVSHNHEHKQNNDHQHDQNNHDRNGHDHSDHDGHGHGHHAHMIDDFKKRFWISLALSVPIIILAPMIQELLGYEFGFEGDRYVQFALSSIIYFYGGWPFLKGAYDEIRKKSPGMMTLIALAVSVAYLYSSGVVFGLEGKIFFWELAGLIDIMLLGHWIEMKSVMGASNALQELARLMPSTAHKVDGNGETKDIEISELKNDDIILVKPGEKIPADGEVVDGKTHVNESMLTGESKPVSKSTGDDVIGGAVNDNGSIKIRVKHTGDETFLSKVIGMVKEAQDAKSKTQNLADKAAAWLFYLALGAGIITFFAWYFTGHDLEFSLERMVTVMIISCPHALGLAIPLVVAISTTMAAKMGLLIRNRTAFENSRKLTVIIFDKTGTLTKGEFGVTRFQATNPDYSNEDILQIAASAESSSEHPIAAGIVKKSKDLELENLKTEDFENITGKGIMAKVNKKSVLVVSPGFLKEHDITIPEDAFNDELETVVFVFIDDNLCGFIALADEIREDSYEAVKVLHDHGLKVIMATGDNEKVAKTVSEKLGLDSYYAEVLPDHKQEIVKQLQDKNEFVAMTGDGVNDAPALAQANVGIAIGSGTDVAAETADIILVNSNPKDVSNLILFGNATYKKMVQNLYWAVGYNIVAVPLAAGVLAPLGILLSPAIGAVLMSLSTVIVALNAQLLKRQMH
jgi:Cu2+-exporting ATPase